MNVTLTVEVPERTAQLVRELAARSGQAPNKILNELLDRSLAEIPVERLPDAEVLVIADMMMDERDQEELADLLDDQREGTLNASQRLRLDQLMQVYRRGMVRKSEALKIAVQRGLRSPLS